MIKNNAAYFDQAVLKLKVCHDISCGLGAAIDFTSVLQRRTIPVLCGFANKWCEQRCSICKEGYISDSKWRKVSCVNHNWVLETEALIEILKCDLCHC